MCVYVDIYIGNTAQYVSSIAYIVHIYVHKYIETYIICKRTISNKVSHNIYMNKRRYVHIFPFRLWGRKLGRDVAGGVRPKRFYLLSKVSQRHIHRSKAPLNQ